MSNINNKTPEYKTQIKDAFKSLEPGNNGILEAKQLNDLNKIMNINHKNPFMYNTINSLISKKNEEKDEYLSSKEFISFLDEELNDTNSKEGIEKIFNVFCDKNKQSFPLMKLAMSAKELGDNDTANKLLKLLEQSKLYNKEINLEEFCDILNDDDDYDDNNNINSHNESDNYEENEYKKSKKKIKKKKEEAEDLKTYSSKNEDSKKSLEENEINEVEKTNKRYHRRYRDTKNKSENNDKVNNNNKYKGQTKYRKNK